ncbi:Uncharacterised protein [BD1-7 clade bacterium]|uniref:Uncharacterized protein n=1 Tax=BD1-7 clade bacterium TaxID=2029982 RepID=A0A5S9P5V5_9GAMM|nr:Uncharacterised protein [BD1-7 clade bacterium]
MIVALLLFRYKTALESREITRQTQLRIVIHQRG